MPSGSRGGRHLEVRLEFRAIQIRRGGKELRWGVGMHLLYP